MRTLLLFATALLFQFSVFSQQPGDLDPNYGNGGITPSNPYSSYNSSMVVQPDGKVIVRSEYNMRHTVITRFTLNGSLDSSFHNDGILEIKNFYGTYSDNLALQPDGKLLVSETRFGPFGYANADVFVRRYYSNGRRDMTFGESGVVRIDLSATDAAGNTTHADDDLLSVAVQANGDILLAILYYKEDDPETGHSAIVTCSKDGVITNIRKLAPQPGDYFEYTQVSAYKDGGYVFTAEAENFRGTFIYSSKFGDKILGPVGGFTTNISHHILENGKIAILETGYFLDETPGRSYVRLLNADGSTDTNFSGDGLISFDGFFRSISSQKDGKLLIGGERTIIRLNANGRFDASFGDNGIINFPNEKVVVYGSRLYATTEEKVAAFLLNTDPRSVKVNLHGNTDPYNHGEWNNWNNIKNRHFDDFYYSDSTASNISAYMTNRTTIIDNGSSYGSNSSSLMAPKEVLRHTSYSDAPRTVTLSGLTPAKKYDVELYSSRNDHSGNSTVFTVNGVAKSVSTYRNYSRKVVFENLTPDASGKIVINLKSSTTYNYLNGFILTEKFNTTTTAVQENNTEINDIEKDNSAAEAVSVNVFPNPSQGYFTLKLKSKSNEPVQLRMINETGRVVEQKTVGANSIQTFGSTYKPGIYFVEVIQGTSRKLVKLVKIN